MKRWMACLGAAVRFALIEQLRNRLALVILVVYVPVWITLTYTVPASDPLRFHLSPAGRTVTMDGNVLTQMGGALHALALIVGFMMFLATTRSAPFDQRLVRAGYPRLCLALAKFTALVLAAAVVAAYGALWMRAYWRPQQLLLLGVGLFVGALIYGGVGIMLAAVLRSELAGMFLVIMVSFVDLGLQNPLANPASDSPLMRYLPAYGAMQTVVTAGALHLVPWHELVQGLLWAVAMAAVGMSAFALRSRSRRPTRAPLPPPSTGGTNSTGSGSGGSTDAGIGSRPGSGLPHRAGTTTTARSHRPPTG
ncbi:ABC transporter permease [Streptomyces sp. DT2A-34]|uniref:ABC transporter permease n=1 Tax=Streptomyces sp. DT2A-34 TaxID=3051182 RepID=UPI00265C3096|nr:ABC transporter permease [Streptomyces sp. DT2A-34]MDO0910978.1 ABC transporter permease [Streptomyces sp. DT2A-34]